MKSIFTSRSWKIAIAFIFFGGLISIFVLWKFSDYRGEPEVQNPDAINQIFGEPAPEIDSEDWYSHPRTSDLTTFGEPALHDSSERPYVYEVRVFWSRTMHAPISIRASFDGKTTQMKVVRLEGRGGYDNGPVDLEKKFSLSSEDVHRLRALTKDPKVRDPLDGLTTINKLWLWSGHGSHWILEIRDGEEYFTELVPSPHRNAKAHKEGLYDAFEEYTVPDLQPFIDVCDLMLAIAREEIPHLYEDNEYY